MMTNYSSNFTNFIELFNELNLNPRMHNLWVVHHDPNVPINYFINKIKSSPSHIKHFLLDQEQRLTSIPLDFDNVYVWESTVQPEIPRHFTYLWWFDETVKVSKKLNLLQYLIENNSKKPKFKFDALLGDIKPHRSFIFDNLKNSNLLDKCIWNMWDMKNCSIPQQWIRGSDFERFDYNNFYPRTIYEDESEANTSTFLPIEIYNNTWYSIVAETDEKTSFLTEKTAKPLLAKRIFISFGPQHQLKKIKELGFFTFGNIINESYDDEPEPYKRWQMAFDEVVKLSTQDPYELYSIVKDQLEHNQERMLHFSWDERMRTEIKAILNLENKNDRIC